MAKIIFYGSINLIAIYFHLQFAVHSAEEEVGARVPNESGLSKILCWQHRRQRLQMENYVGRGTTHSSHYTRFKFEM